MFNILSRHSRTRVLLIGLLIIGTVFIVRLFWLQVIRHDHYETLALQSQVTKFTIPAKRGLVYARDGENKVAPLVMNEPVYTAYADPQEVEDKEAIVNIMRRVAGGNTLKDFDQKLDDKDLRYTVMAKELNRKQAELIKKENLAGVGLQEGTKRVYPEGQLAAQLLGYVDADGKGQYGLEGKLNDHLKGTNGLLNAVTDVRRIPLSISKDYIRVPAKDGDNLVLSVDINIQKQAETALKAGLDKVRATKGSAIVMDPNTGRVLAMANFPTYNPDKYNEVEDYSVFQNKIVSAPYEAGSVMKTLTMGAGLDSGAVTINSRFNNTNSVKVDDTLIKNVEEDPLLPNATMTDVLHYSLNTGVVYVLQQMGGGSVNERARQTLYDYFSGRYLFGKSTGIEQANERPGTIIGPNEGFGRNVRYANMAFGQGMDVTMIQTVAAFSAAINGGNYYKPTLLMGTRDEDGEITSQEPDIVRSGVLSPQNSALLKNMVRDARKLGFLGKDDKKGYFVGGKTGTSQIIDPETGKYTNKDSIGSYLGFGANGDGTPKYVIMVRVDDSKAAGYAGTTAAGPIFADISNWLLGYMKVTPIK